MIHGPDCHLCLLSGRVVLQHSISSMGLKCCKLDPHSNEYIFPCCGWLEKQNLKLIKIKQAKGDEDKLPYIQKGVSYNVHV